MCAFSCVDWSGIARWVCERMAGEKEGSVKNRVLKQRRWAAERTTMKRRETFCKRKRGEARDVLRAFGMIRYQIEQ